MDFKRRQSCDETALGFTAEVSFSSTGSQDKRQITQETTADRTGQKKSPQAIRLEPCSVFLRIACAGPPGPISGAGSDA
jgi:hypothetical protein